MSSTPHFPIYMDYGATTPCDPRVVDAMIPWLREHFGNPASRSHAWGWEAEEAVEKARKDVADLIGADPREIVWTSGATESNNLALKGAAQFYKSRGKHLITVKTEHKAVLDTMRELERQGFEATYLEPGANGLITVEQLAAAIRPDTILVSVMWVNNETGTSNPVHEYARIAEQHGIPLHVDAVQAATTEDVNMHDYRFAAMSLSGHKLGAPKGSGALFVRDGVPFEPLIHGGGQEHGMRSGTENVAWAVAFATALEITHRHSGFASTLPDTQRFIERVLARVPGAQLTGNAEHRSPLIVSFVFEGVSGETVLLELERHGIVCSSGSACAAGRDEPSHVLTAMGYSDDLARTAVRFSFAKQIEDQKTTAETEPFDIERVVGELHEVVSILRGRMNS